MWDIGIDEPEIAFALFLISEAERFAYRDVLAVYVLSILQTGESDKD